MGSSPPRAEIGKLAPFTKMRCASPRHDPGGGGINVARVVKRPVAKSQLSIRPVAQQAIWLRRLMDREGVRGVADATSYL